MVESWASRTMIYHGLMQRLIPRVRNIDSALASTLSTLSRELLQTISGVSSTLHHVRLWSLQVASHDQKNTQTLWSWAVLAVEQSYLPGLPAWRRLHFLLILFALLGGGGEDLSRLGMSATEGESWTTWTILRSTATPLEPVPDLFCRAPLLNVSIISLGFCSPISNRYKEETIKFSPSRSSESCGFPPCLMKIVLSRSVCKNSRGHIYAYAEVNDAHESWSGAHSSHESLKSQSKRFPRLQTNCDLFGFLFEEVHSRLPAGLLWSTYMSVTLVQYLMTSRSCRSAITNEAPGHSQKITCDLFGSWRLHSHMVTNSWAYRRADPIHIRSATFYEWTPGQNSA